MVCFIWVLICKKVQFFVGCKSNEGPPGDSSSQASNEENTSGLLQIYWTISAQRKQQNSQEEPHINEEPDNI